MFIGGITAENEAGTSITLGSLLHANSNFGFQGNAGDDLATNDDEDWAQAGAPLQSAGQMRRRAI